MKKRQTLQQIAYTCIMAVVFSCLTIACDEENNSDIKPGTEKIGKVEFDIDLNNGNDEYTVENETPINVEAGDTLSVSIGQTATYKDPNGETYTVEPKATIDLFIQTDTVYTKDIKELTTLANTNTKSTTDGSNPTRHNTTRHFTIGTQEVKFNLMYETYNYVNSASQAIEMPYIKVNHAIFGVAKTHDVPNAPQPAITIKKVSPTRTSISDTNIFEVNAQFSVGIETVNTKEVDKRTIIFNAKYIAVVENVTELDGIIEYTVDGSVDKLTTNNVVTPEAPFIIELQQKSYFAATDTVIGICNPIARLSVLATNSITFTTSLDSLLLFESATPQTSIDGENPARTTSKYIFNAGGGRSIEFETMHDVFAYDENEPLPYLMFGEPTKTDINLTELGHSKNVTAADTTFYKIETVFNVPVKSVNAKNPIDETLKFTVEHIGGVVTEIDTVIYHKDFLFFEAEYNLPDRVIYAVYRDIHYSNGTVKSDSTYSPCVMFLVQRDNFAYDADAEIQNVFYANEQQTTGYMTLGTMVFPFKIDCTYRQGLAPQSNHVHARYTQVPDPSLITMRGSGSVELDVGADDFSNYRHENTNEYFNANNPQDGWYYIKRRNYSRFHFYYNKVEIFNTEIEYGAYTLFLYIDGRIIDFLDFLPQIEDKDIVYENYDTYGDWGKTKIIKHQYTGTFLGKEINVILSDTFYAP